jgi:hypothetical protein
MELQAGAVGGEGAACRAFAFFDILLAFDVLLAALVVESNDALPGLVRLVTMKPTRGQKLARMRLQPGQFHADAGDAKV